MEKIIKHENGQSEDERKEEITSGRQENEDQEDTATYSKEDDIRRLGKGGKKRTMKMGGREESHRRDKWVKTRKRGEGR